MYRTLHGHKIVIREGRAVVEVRIHRAAYWLALVQDGAIEPPGPPVVMRMPRPATGLCMAPWITGHLPLVLWPASVAVPCGFSFAMLILI